MLMMNELVLQGKLVTGFETYIFPTQQQSELNGCVSILVNIFVMLTELD